MVTMKHFDFKTLMEYQERLSFSKSPTIHHFMVNEVCFGYDRNPVWIELAELLEATMKLENGWWIDKDILD